MVRDINRFLNQPNHQQADAETFGLRGHDLESALTRVRQSSDRTEALRDLYVARLESTGPHDRLRYVTSVRVAERGPSDTVYFLVHASSHPLGKREMKEAIWEATGGFNAVLGAKDPNVIAETIGQIDMFSGRESREMRVDRPALRTLLLEQFSERRLEYESLQNEAVNGHVFDAFIDSHIKKALDDLIAQRLIRCYRDRLPSTRPVRRKDILEFPA
jgi:hypothetical protein